MHGTIYLDIITSGRRSHAELNISRDDIEKLYEEEFGTGCISCHSPLGDSIGNMCCECFREEMQHHTDCCLAEEGG